MGSIPEFGPAISFHVPVRPTVKAITSEPIAYEQVAVMPYQKLESRQVLNFTNLFFSRYKSVNTNPWGGKY